ncbi:VWA domain-containing protein [bacterium]|nr:VWA domain-containing protein [bacterium]
MRKGKLARVAIFPYDSFSDMYLPRKALPFLIVSLSSAFLIAQEPLREDLQVTLVTLYVSATDTRGDFVTYLTPEDFLVKENGVQQTISSFSSGNEDAPLTVAFVVDNSGSMTAANLEMARSAGFLLLKEMKPNDKMSLIAFRHDATSLVELTFEKNRIENMLRTMRPQYGTTALYDAIYFSAGKLDTELGRKVLILFSDGQDNTSRHRLNSLLDEVAALSDITILSIGTLFQKEEINRYGAIEEYKKGRAAMEKLAEVTGGFSIFPENKAALEEAVTDLRSLIRNQYTLGYYPTNRNADGTWREINLECKRKGIRLLTRKGYYARR